MANTLTPRRPLPDLQPPARQIDCDAAVELLHGDRIPKRGTALLGVLVYDDGQLVGECTLRETIIERGPTGHPVEYQRLHWKPFDPEATSG